LADEKDVVVPDRMEGDGIDAMSMGASRVAG
jgi:hypothetical protein